MSTTNLPVASGPSELHALPLRRELVPVPEWGKAFWVWEMNGDQIDEYRAGMFDQSGRNNRVKINMRRNTARLLAHTIRNEDGTPFFGSEAEGVHILLGLGAAGAEKLAAVARRLSGLDDEDDEDAEGNSDAGPTGSPSSTLPSPSGAPSET